MLRIRRTGLGRAGFGDGIKDVLDLGGATSEIKVPKAISWVFDEFDKGDEKAPRIRTIDDETLKKDTSDLLLDEILCRF